MNFLNLFLGSRVLKPTVLRPRRKLRFEMLESRQMMDASWLPASQVIRLYDPSYDRPEREDACERTAAIDRYFEQLGSEKKTRGMDERGRK